MTLRRPHGIEAVRVRVFRAFEQVSGVKVRGVYDTEETKSTGVLNRLIAESARPQADVFWSGDPVRPFVLIDRGLVLHGGRRGNRGRPRRSPATRWSSATRPARVSAAPARMWRAPRAYGDTQVGVAHQIDASCIYATHHQRLCHRAGLPSRQAARPRREPARRVDDERGRAVGHPHEDVKNPETALTTLAALFLTQEGK